MKREAPVQPGQPTPPNEQMASLSEVMMAFAAPLLALDEQAAADPDVLSHLMVLVDMCWNLPILQTSDPEAHAKLKQGFDNIVKEVPVQVAEQLSALQAARSARFGGLSFLVNTRVDTDAAGKALIVAEARKPRSEH